MSALISVWERRCELRETRLSKEMAQKLRQMMEEKVEVLILRSKLTVILSSMSLRRKTTE